MEKGKRKKEKGKRGEPAAGRGNQPPVRGTDGARLEPIRPDLKEPLQLKLIREKALTQIKKLGVEFPTFRVEDFFLKDKIYYRGVWYINSKKKQLYMGSEKKVHTRLEKVVDGFGKLKQIMKNKKILEVYLPEFQLNYWEKEYEEFKNLR